MPEAFNSDIFNLAPIAMSIEDFSEVKALFDIWRAQGVTDIKAFFCGRRSGGFRNVPAESACST